MDKKLKQALLIGPSYGSDLPSYCQPLKGVHNDVLLMKEMLTRNGFLSENIKVLEGDYASKEEILRSLEELSSTVLNESVVIIYFSGHGYQLKEEFDQGLIPGGLKKEMFNEYRINEMCITGKHFKRHLCNLMKKKCLVNTIFDCCFSGRLYRGFMEKGEAPPIPKQLNLPKEYVEKYCEKLKSKGPRKPAEHEDPTTVVNESLRDHEPVLPCIQENQPPNPAQHSGVRLPYSKQEFWTPEGWKPSQHDRFIHIAACAYNEQAFEDPHPTKPCGRLTSALVKIMNEVQKENKKISYDILSSLIKQKCQAEYKDPNQTPQFEGGNMDMVVFDFSDTVSQPKALEICDVIFREEKVDKVLLNAGKLHGVVDGQYDVYKSDVTDDEVNSNATSDSKIGQIEVMEENIHTLKSFAKVLDKDVEGKIKVGCKAVLKRRRSMCTSVFVNFPTCTDQSQVEQEHKDRLIHEIEKQGMFAIERSETTHSVTLDIQIVEEKHCWRACQYGRMIVPYQACGDEHLMMKNLSKYFRHKFAISPKCSDPDMLKNVTFEVFRIENVPSFKNSVDKKNELIHQAIQKGNRYSGFQSNEPFTVRAHKVKLVSDVLHGCYRKKYKVIDGSGDALVIKVTNNEKFLVHVCVMSYQADGSIVVLYPPKNGKTEELDEGESAKAIKRVFVEPQTVRRMTEPDFDKPKPKWCDDILILYATKAEADYKPLTQTAIDLSEGLSTRGHNPPDEKTLPPVTAFRDALSSPSSFTTQSAGSSREATADYSSNYHDPRWLTIRRDVRILCNEDLVTQQEEHFRI